MRPLSAALASREVLHDVPDETFRNYFFSVRKAINQRHKVTGSTKFAVNYLVSRIRCKRLKLGDARVSALD
jgi:hypothetical protein